MNKEKITPVLKTKRSRISQSDIPSYSLEKIRQVPQSLADNYASQPTRVYHHVKLCGKITRFEQW
ncbi:hypothetical protein [Bifidobacterium tibiigranuli]|jgi:hypothetical protein|uniref:hypothetical protein n=1 Tax=Bifidobacterium tibiigranuli TaxID=2172043 RepID=UPI0023521807|nr:hypothetical protein [Bifidobacterium tibiigranuli]MCH3975173.1 hypothetical protein [Bifidobacterium tibiigranuli]